MMIEAKGPRTLQLVMRQDGCTLWRVWQPTSELSRRDYPVRWGPNEDPGVWAQVPNFQVVTLPRQTWREDRREKAERWMNSLHEAGIATVGDWDDDVFSPEIAERFFELFAKERPLTPAITERERIDRVWALSFVDGITVASEPLAEVVKAYTDKPIFVVPNYIDLVWWRQVIESSRRQTPKPTIGWIGGNRLPSDLDVMLEAWVRVGKRYPQARFIVQGHMPEDLRQLEFGQVIYIPWLPVETYPAGYAQVDIGCAALEDNIFNRSKTPVKALEYGASGCAVVASPTVYDQVIRDGENGLLANSVDEWEAKLSRLIEDEELRQRLADTLLAEVEEKWSLQHQERVLAWPQAWSEIRSSLLSSRQSAGLSYTELYVPSQNNPDTKT